MAERIFSIRTGLAASTVTPGKIAPDVSFTIPVNELCACAAAGSRTKTTNATGPHVRCLVMTCPSRCENPQGDDRESAMQGCMLLLCRGGTNTKSGTEAKAAVADR